MVVRVKSEWTFACAPDYQYVRYHYSRYLVYDAIIYFHQSGFLLGCFTCFDVVGASRTIGRAVHGPMSYKNTDSRTPAERQAARKAFESAMRIAVMEFDSVDNNEEHLMDFKAFSAMIRERELGIHSEVALRERFDEVRA